MKRVIYLLLFAAAMVPITARAQMDTVSVPGVYATGVEGTLNDSVSAVESADSLNNTDKLSSTVFKLTANDQYVLTGTITVPLGETLNIVGPTPGNTQATALPQIIWTATGNPAETYNFDCFGNIYLKNVWLMYANKSGAQVGSSLQMEDDSLADLSGAGERGTFDDVIFDYCPIAAGGGDVNVSCKDFKGTFTNCFFRNDVDTHFLYYGRAVSFPYNSVGWHTDSVSFTNCTFANLGYVLMQEGSEYSSNVWFNHCTFENVIEFVLESGWWKNLVFTNCIVDNPWMYGETQASINSGGGGGSGVFPIDSVSTFGFSVPFTDQQRHILFANNSYSYEPWLLNYMANGPYTKSLIQTRADSSIPMPDSMLNVATEKFFTMKDSSGAKAFPYMNWYKVNRYNGVNPEFVAQLSNIDSIEGFLYEHWTADNDVNWAFEPDSDLNQVWPLPGNLAYTNDTLMTAGINGFPLGDLYHWWNGSNGGTDYYSQWKAVEATQDANITKAEMTGDLAAIGGPTPVLQSPGANQPRTFTLSQNYPNPFNPTTLIEYSVPKNSFVTLNVYNILGQKVATLFSGMRSPGEYTATFNGSSLASGVYFYRLDAGTVQMTKKLMLIK